MRRFLTVIAAAVLVTVACTERKLPTVPEEPVAAVDSVEAEPAFDVADSLEQLLTDTPMPKAADELFDDFVFNFAANKRLQMERIVFPLTVRRGGQEELVDKRHWQMEHFFMRQGYYSLIFGSDGQMQLMRDTSLRQATVEKIMLKKGLVRSYRFSRLRGAWMMHEVVESPIAAHPDSSFLTFYARFASDSAFQVRSLNATVSFVGPDPDDDFSTMEGIITPDTWDAFAPTLPQKTIYNIIYGQPVSLGDWRIFILRGIANGEEMELRFRRVGERWLLMKITT